eukprot:TRINITY_DN6938_c0_g1_i6.p1 TRINITY_DN6938_c0_g1~~TRINITY_DN6938_c0_g1_i6.p1  ORF type:complete len:477 (-),score=153.41 TRINITY_DN6938_c0_g1_i6:322-1752(-)
MCIRDRSITQLGWIEAPYLDFDNDHTIVYPMATFAIFLVATLLAQILGDMWLLDVMWNIIRAPFVHVAFKDFYVADQLTTLAISLVDFEFSMCYLFAGGFDDSSATESHACVDQNNTLKPYIAMIPSWWRLMQCFRRYWDSCPATAEGVLGKDLKAGDKGQLWNALKYGCAFPVTITSVIRKAHDNSDVTTGFWIVAVAVGALYKLYWDIYKDWGLGDLSNRYLRTPKKDQDGNILPNRMNHLYPIPCYYMAIAANVVLRFGWAMTVSPQFINPDGLTTGLACAEILRRGLWNLFRVENQHLHNCDDFRAVSFRTNGLLGKTAKHVDGKLFPTIDELNPGVIAPVPGDADVLSSSPSQVLVPKPKRDTPEEEDMDFELKEALDDLDGLYGEIDALEPSQNQVNSIDKSADELQIVVGGADLECENEFSGGVLGALSEGEEFEEALKSPEVPTEAEAFHEVSTGLETPDEDDAPAEE